LCQVVYFPPVGGPLLWVPRLSSSIWGSLNCSFCTEIFGEGWIHQKQSSFLLSPFHPTSQSFFNTFTPSPALPFLLVSCWLVKQAPHAWAMSKLLRCFSIRVLGNPLSKHDLRFSFFAPFPHFYQLTQFVHFSIFTIISPFA